MSFVVPLLNPRPLAELGFRRLCFLVVFNIIALSGEVPVLLRSVSGSRLEAEKHADELEDHEGKERECGFSLRSSPLFDHTITATGSSVLSSDRKTGCL